jgi:hypothetical protein
MSKTMTDNIVKVPNDDTETIPSKTNCLNEASSQKYLVVTGVRFVNNFYSIINVMFFFIKGTISGVGKGTTMSSLGVILKAMGFNVTAIKIDPYLVRNHVEKECNLNEMHLNH